MTEADDRLKARLSLLIPVNNLPPKHQDKILRSAEVLEFRKKEYVFLQGDRDNYSFYVLNGVVEMYADDQLIKKVVGGEGSSFHALSQLQPRQMSARAQSRLSVLRVDRSLLDKLLSLDTEEQPPNEPDIEVKEIEASGSTDWLTSILQSELFSRIPPSNIQRLLETLESVRFKAGDVVVEQGGPGDYYYSIQTGTCVVTRTTSTQKKLKLAELGPGDTFGEEALVSNATRNATVSMITDGELARLTKDTFIDLITKPVLTTVSLEEAEERVKRGALWLDVRFPEEYEANSISGSLNIPLSFLRNEMDELSTETSYVVYCDTGGRSSAAAFLLAERGFEVCYVEGGAINEAPLPKSGPQKRVRKPANQSPASRTVQTESSDGVLEADSRAQSLSADLEKAKLQIEQARRLMDEAEAAKRDAERIVQAKLKAEREKLTEDAEKIQAELAAAQRLKNEMVSQQKAVAEEAAAARRNAERMVEEKLGKEREKLAEDAAKLRRNLAEAERLKSELEAQQRAAADEALQRHREQEAQIERRREEAEKKLLEEEQRLGEVYRRQEEKLEAMQSEQMASEKELEAAWRELEVESTHTRARLEAAKALEDEMREKERRQIEGLKIAEQRLREQLQKELSEERHRLEAQFAETTAEIAHAKRELEAAEKSKQAAEEEARKIIEEYKEEQRNLFVQHEARFALERKKLEREAKQLRMEMEQVVRMRDEAEHAKHEADALLEVAIARPPAAAVNEVQLRAEIEMIEKRALAAADQLRHAIEAKTTVEDQQRENEKRLERTYESKNEINILMQKELEEWVAEQERLQTSTAQQGVLHKQQAQTARIQARAVHARDEARAREKALLDEIAEQLEG